MSTFTLQQPQFSSLFGERPSLLESKFESIYAWLLGLLQSLVAVFAFLEAAPKTLARCFVRKQPETILGLCESRVFTFAGNDSASYRRTRANALFV